MTPFLLLSIGLLLIFLEFYLPGAILAIAGALLIVASIIFFAWNATHSLWVLFFIVLCLALTVILIKFTLWRIRKAKPGKGIFLHQDQEGYIASSFQKELIGKRGIASSDLKPSGHILIDGNSYQAVSKTGYIFKGSEIQIVGGEGAHLIVKFI